MAKANVDPSELRQFARDMHRFNNELQGMMHSLNSRSRQLAQSWQDQEQRKFAEQFDQTFKQLQRFTEHCEEHAQFLVRKAAQIETYLNR